MPYLSEKKESPIMGIGGVGGGVGSNLVAGLGDKYTYVETVFHTEVFKSTNQNADYKVTNNLDNSGEGGFLWYKQRNGTSYNLNWDTARGSNKYIYSNASAGESTGVLLKSFDSDGYTIQTGTTLVDPARENVLWNFRKAPGFFDVVTYTGNGTGNHQISHNLGSVPGCIMVKCTSESQDWMVYHIGTTDAAGAGGAYLKLNSNEGQIGSSGGFQNATATSTHFALGDSDIGNKSGATFVAYVFAGGESTAAGASSIDYPGNGRTYTTSPSNSFNMGTGDFTIECWVNFDGSANKGVFQISPVSEGLTTSNTGTSLAVAYNGTNWHCYGAGGQINSDPVSCSPGTWNHIAYVRNNSVTKLYVNGTKVAQAGDNVNYNGTYITIGGYYTTSYLIDGKISNFRVVKGTAVYTDSFTPPTEPLTSINNTVLLCNNDSTNNEGSTITPTALTTANGNAKTYSPFDDLEGYKFGESEDKPIIKCGQYRGNGASDGPEIPLGWEPQWVMVKRIDSGGYDWLIWDTMRGIFNGSNQPDPMIYPNNDGPESSSIYRMNTTPIGFKLTSSNNAVNSSSGTYIYMAVRRPDGYVGKPAKFGTDVFNLTLGNGSASIPSYTAGFPVDFAISRELFQSGTTNPAGAGNYASSRLQGARWLSTHDGGAEYAPVANFVFDSNTGWTRTYPNNYFSWMWKRHAGFDVVTWKGNGTLGKTLPHSMGIPPEMIWVKNRSASHNWYAGHIGLNGGVDPWQKYIDLNLSGVGGDYTVWNDTPPTSTHFQVGHEAGYNGNGNEMIAYLFASVTGISKCGYYDGSSSTITITTGFTPRFLIIKRTTGSDNWFVLDTERGWGAGDDKYLELNTTSGQAAYDFGAPTSSGFTLNSVAGITGGFNLPGEKYIYYAHA